MYCFHYFHHSTQLLIGCKPGWTKAEAAAIFRLIDSNGNQSLSIDEFAAWWEVRHSLTLLAGKEFSVSLVFDWKLTSHTGTGSQIITYMFVVLFQSGEAVQITDAMKLQRQNVYSMSALQTNLVALETFLGANNLKSQLAFLRYVL